MNLAYYLLICLLLFGASLILIKKFISIAYKYNILDIPNHRSSHRLPIVRGGGVVIALLSILVIIICYWVGLLSSNVALAMGCSSIVAISGFIDDLIGLSVKVRLIIQIIASVLTVYLIVPLNFSNGTLLNIIVWIVSIMLILWSTNLCNFMDGTDGLTAVEAIFVLTITGLLLLGAAKASGFATCLLLIVPIIAGFLYFNWPPAKIFMGDVGSNFLGFLIGTSALISHFLFGVSLIFWVMMYSVFCFDATITLLRRLIAKQPWYLAHRLHAYQRLQDIGWQHNKILYSLLILNVCLALIVIVAYYNNCRLLAGGFIGVLLTAIYLIIEKNVPMEQNQKTLR